jgi:hypothetical protein
MGLIYKISGDDLIVDMEENLENFRKEQRRGRIVGIVLLLFFFIGIIPIIIGTVTLNDMKKNPEKYEKKFEDKARKKANKKRKNLVITNRPQQQAVLPNQ